MRAVVAIALAACGGAGGRPEVIASVPAGGGLPALERHLRDGGDIAQHRATSEDVLALVERFEAFPPHRNAQGEPDPRNYFHGKYAPAGLRPHLDYLDAGRATFTMNYRNTETGDAPGDSGTMRVYAWTLAIEPVAPLAWTLRIRQWDTVEKRFVDLAHD